MAVEPVEPRSGGSSPESVRLRVIVPIAIALIGFAGLVLGPWGAAWIARFAPDPTPAIVNATPSATALGPGCFGTFVGLNPISTEYRQDGGYVHVQFWRQGEQQRNTLLTFGAGVVAYRIRTELSGTAWSYPASCTEAYVKQQMQDSSKNSGDAGLVDWRNTGYFEITP